MPDTVQILRGSTHGFCFMWQVVTPQLHFYFFCLDMSGFFNLNIYIFKKQVIIIASVVCSLWKRMTWHIWRQNSEVDYDLLLNTKQYLHYKRPTPKLSRELVTIGLTKRKKIKMVRVRQKSSYKHRAGKDEVWRSTLRTWTELTQWLTNRKERERGRERPTNTQENGRRHNYHAHEWWLRKGRKCSKPKWEKENRGKKEREKESKKQRNKQRKKITYREKSFKNSEFSCLVNMKKIMSYRKTCTAQQNPIRVV